MTFMKIVKHTCRIETHRDELIEYLFVTLSYEAEFVDTLKALNFAIGKNDILRVFNFAIWWFQNIFRVFDFAISV